MSIFLLFIYSYSYCPFSSKPLILTNLLLKFQCLAFSLCPRNTINLISVRETSLFLSGCLYFIVWLATFHNMTEKKDHFSKIPAFLWTWLMECKPCVKLQHLRWAHIWDPFLSESEFRADDQTEAPPALTGQFWRLLSLMEAWESEL